MKAHAYEQMHLQIIREELQIAEDTVKRLQAYGPGYQDLRDNTPAMQERVRAISNATNRCRALQAAARDMEAMSVIRGAVFFTG